MIRRRDRTPPEGGLDRRRFGAVGLGHSGTIRRALPGGAGARRNERLVGADEGQQARARPDWRRMFHLLKRWISHGK